MSASQRVSRGFHWLSVLTASITLALFPEPSRAAVLTCQFEGGTQIPIGSDGTQTWLGSTSCSSCSKQLSFEFNPANGVTAGRYRNVDRDWDGETYVLTGGGKITIIENASYSDNHFIVTIFTQKQTGRGYPAIYSQHAFVPNIELYNPQQLMGWCR